MINEQTLFSKIQHNRALPTMFAGQQFVLDASGALYWPKHDLLVFSDLHFEKGSFLSQFANPLPKYDSSSTIAKMSTVIEAYTPRMVLCLGDSFHDGNAAVRMLELDKQALNVLVESVEEWTWVLGNHDPEIPSEIFGQSLPYLLIDDILWVHEPEKLADFPDANAQVIGHFHPKITVRKRRQKMVGKCFISTTCLFLMPAMGQYTGGLDAEHEAITSLHEGHADYTILYNNKIFAV
jgi:DNA ligase-associated metallophosphoesterase